MLFAGMNFATQFLAVSGRSLRPYLHDPEAGWFVGICFISIFIVAVYIWKDGMYADLDTAVRHSAFNVVSIATDHRLRQRRILPNGRSLPRCGCSSCPALRPAPGPPAAASR